jgi:hypothetical protein
MLAFVIPGTFPLGLGAEALDPGLWTALLLDFRRGILCSGDLEDQTRATRVALETPIDERLHDGVRLLANHLVDGVAQTGRTLTGRSFGSPRRGAFTAALRAWFFRRASGLRWVGYFSQLLYSGHLPLNDSDWMS